MRSHELSAHLRDWQNDARRAREADAPARALRLAPEVVTYWIRQIEKARPFVRPGRRPCDYGPWVSALDRARGGADPEAHAAYRRAFRAFMEDIALPAWPDPRRDLIDYALTFLEADVMLFRSGYAKRHLIRRLQQSPLADADIARIEPMLRRAVVDGTGLEEFRAWCKLAAHLVARGHLADLPGWLAARAEGAILTLDQADGPFFRHVRSAGLTDEEVQSLSRGPLYGPRTFGLRWPGMDALVPAGEATRTDRQRIARNAWKMRDRIRRRAPGSPADVPHGPDPV